MSTSPIRTLTSAFFAAAFLVFLLGTPASAQTQRFVASAALVDHVPGDKGVTVEISIDRWSTDDERQTLIKTFHRGGTEALQDALEGSGTVGTLRTPDGASWDLHYAVQAPFGDKGRRIFLATDEPVELWEVYDNSAPTGSLFTFLEIRLDDEGKGQGRLARASDVELSSNGRQIQLDDYSSQPLPLQNVRRVE